MNLLKLIEKQCEDEKHLVKDLTFAFKASLYQKMIIPDSSKFNDLINELQELSLGAKSELLSKDLENLKNNDKVEIPSKETPAFRFKLTPLFRSKLTPVFRSKLTPAFLV